MIKYLGKRFARSIVTLFIIIIIVFSLLRLMPIEGYFQNFDKLTEAQIQAGLDNMGLNKPLIVQLFDFFKNLLKGDLGISRTYRANVPIVDIISDKVPISMKFGIASIGISMLVGIPMGLFMAKSKGKFFDKLGTGFIVFIQAVPAAVYFLFIQVYGTEWLNLKLLFKANDPSTWILPLFSLAIGNIAYYAMWLRRYMVDESNKDYVKLAKAKGLSSSRIMSSHVFRNAFVPMVQYIPTSILNTMIGSIYVESLYSIPGMGGLLVNVVQKQDNMMVQALVILFASVGILGLMLGDVLMCIIDPRISLTKKGGAR
ncbi:ABC transporter permease [Clostridium sp. Marseille-P299]|uniref:ABC transporter permease n=1 Tax=Clostridium sp. Marseille-P299 TaxID=1805477 RepID=UPI00083315CF|nr:ABC transporter permease [Clostridium sp. Marseille-P299]